MQVFRELEMDVAMYGRSAFTIKDTRDEFTVKRMPPVLFYSTYGKQSWLNDHEHDWFIVDELQYVTQ